MSTLSATPHASAVPPLELSIKARQTSEQPISYLLAAALANPDLVSFAAGLVDQETLPSKEVSQITAELMADAKAGLASLQYGTTHGDAELRQRVLNHQCKLDGVTPQEIGLTPDHVVVTTGSQQALYLLTEVLVSPGDIVITASPTYFVFSGLLRSFGTDVRSVSMDEDGMDIDALDAMLDDMRTRGELSRVRFIYCTSYYQNPTGLTLSAPRRKQLLEVVKKYSTKHRILILEDAAYRELGFDAPPPASIKSLDTENQWVMGTYTFSKPFSPGMKTGYAFLPDDVLFALLQQKGNHDFGSPNICQQILKRAMANGMYDAHVEKLKAMYRTKRDATIAALEKYMPKLEGLSWIKPHGGIYVWLTLPKSVNTSRPGDMFEESVRTGVIYVPGAYCHSDSGDNAAPMNHLRLSYGHVPVAKIDAGIKRLADVVRKLGAS